MINTECTNKEIAFWVASGKGQVTAYNPLGSEFAETTHNYFADADNQIPDVKVRKWNDTEWVIPTREYLGI